jgi:hypothetical protein
MLKNLFIISIAIFFIAFSSKSEEIDKDLLPSMIGASNSGTEFYLTFHPCWENPSNANFIKIFVASIYETDVTIEIKGLGISQTKKTVANGVIEFTFNPSEAMMYSKTDQEKPLPEQVWVDRAVKVTSVDPVIVYGVVRYYATSDGYMALPVSVLGEEYQVSSYNDPTNNTFQWLPSYTSIVGIYDNTKVTFTMGGCDSCFALKSNGEILKINESMNRTLNEGDVWLIPGIGKYNDLTGSKIKGDKPISVFSGNFCAYIPSQVAACDYIIEQELPVFNWGTKYFVTPIFERKNYSILRIFATEANTLIKKDNIPLQNIQTPGGGIGKGFIEVRAGETTKSDSIVKPVTFSATGTINVVQYNPGSQDDGVENDPFQMQILPVEQFQTDVIFNTPGYKGNGFKKNYLNIIYLADSTGKIPDDFMWGEVVEGKFNFVKLSSYSNGTGVEIPFSSVGNRNYRVKTIKIVYDGVYALKANNPFAAYAYGSDYYDSYGFPVAGRFFDVKSGDEEPPTIIYEQDSLGNISGKIEDNGNQGGIIEVNGKFQEADTKPSGLSFASIISKLSKNYKFTSDKFIPGKDNFTNFKLQLIDNTLDAKAVIAISDRRGNDTVFVFNYKGQSLSLPTITALKTNFGVLKSSTEVILPFTIDNNSLDSTFPIKTIFLENNDPQFEIIDNIAPGTILKAGEKHSFSIKFKSRGLNDGVINSVEGKFINKIGIELINGKKLLMNSVEAEVANPRIELTDVNFAGKLLGETHKQEFLYVKNVSKSVLNITKITITGDDAFRITYQENVSPENPSFVPPNSVYYFRVNFEPKTPGQFEAKLEVESDGVVIKKDAVVKGSALPTTVNDNELVSDDVNVIIESGALSLSSKYDYNLTALEIYDLSGRLITNDIVNSQISNYKLRLSGFSAGVYIVKMKINGNWVSKKFSL